MTLKNHSKQFKEKNQVNRDWFFQQNS